MQQLTATQARLMMVLRESSSTRFVNLNHSGTSDPHELQTFRRYDNCYYGGAHPTTGVPAAAISIQHGQCDLSSVFHRFPTAATRNTIAAAEVAVRKIRNMRHVEDGEGNGGDHDMMRMVGGGGSGAIVPSMLNDHDDASTFNDGGGVGRVTVDSLMNPAAPVAYHTSIDQAMVAAATYHTNIDPAAYSSTGSHGMRIIGLDDYVIGETGGPLQDRQLAHPPQSSTSATSDSMHSSACCAPPIAMGSDSLLQDPFIPTTTSTASATNSNSNSNRSPAIANACTAARDQFYSSGGGRGSDGGAAAARNLHLPSSSSSILGGVNDPAPSSLRRRGNSAAGGGGGGSSAAAVQLEQRTAPGRFRSPLATYACIGDYDQLQHINNKIRRKKIKVEQQIDRIEYCDKDIGGDIDMLKINVNNTNTNATNSSSNNIDTSMLDHISIHDNVSTTTSSYLGKELSTVKVTTKYNIDSTSIIDRLKSNTSSTSMSVHSNNYNMKTTWRRRSNKLARNAHGPALNTNGKPRAPQGSANDPQSIAARTRRERINARFKILQELVPNASKFDLVTMLEKAIDYVKLLQLQLKVLSDDELWKTSASTTMINGDGTNICYVPFDGIINRTL